LFHCIDAGEIDLFQALAFRRHVDLFGQDVGDAGPSLERRCRAGFRWKSRLIGDRAACHGERGGDGAYDVYPDGHVAVHFDHGRMFLRRSCAISSASRRSLAISFTLSV
jgi:hypothetical protein